MKIMNKIILMMFALSLFSCGNDKYQQKSPYDVETMNSGKITVYVDEDVKGIIDTGIVMYAKDYKNVLMNTIYKSARETMGQLLSGSSRVVVIARDYLKDEDSLMNVFKVKKHQRLKIATDGLVLFCSKDYPIDTLNANQVKDIFQNGKKLSNIFKIGGEPTFYIENVNSSVYSNFKNLILEGKNLGKNVSYCNNSEELIKNVADNKSAIGIAYLSQVFGDERFKMIEIGYTDTNNVYVSPKPVHQAYIVQGKYPYNVNIWVYLLEDRKNLPFWFASYLAKENKYQKVILEKGIVPEFARFQLVPEKK